MRRLGRSFIAGVLFLGTIAPVRAQGLCSFTQITNTEGSQSGLYAINASGNRMVLNSTADLVNGSGNGLIKLFLWDASAGFTRITKINSSLGMIPAINADGSRIAFSAHDDPLGTNGDGNFEVFLWDASAGLIQITDTITSGMLTPLPQISADGNRIAFHISADLTGNNSDGSVEIFLWDSSTGFTQITNSAMGSSNPSINAGGNRIAFQSSANPLGSNSDGNLEIFLWDASTGLTQITNTISGQSFSPKVNAAGDRIAFESSADPLGSNSDGNSEVYLWDSSAGFIQITNTVGLHNFSIGINAAGNRIVFDSRDNLSGRNSDHSEEVFIWDASSALTQVTDSDESVDSLIPVINAAGDRIAFLSNGNFSGSNSDGNGEIFLASCPLPLQSAAEVPAVSPVGLGALATLLGLAAAWTLRRRRGRLW